MIPEIEIQKRETFFRRCKAYLVDYFAVWGVCLFVAVLLQLPPLFHQGLTVPPTFYNPIEWMEAFFDEPHFHWYKVIVLICGVGLVGFLTPYGIITAAAYYILSWSIWGATLGQFLSGIRVISIKHKALSLPRSCLRYFGCWVSAFALGIGFLWILIDSKRQGWHDKIAGTIVLPIETLTDLNKD